MLVSLLRTISLERHVFAGRQRVILKYNMDLSLRFKIDATWRAEGKGTGGGGWRERDTHTRRRERERRNEAALL